MITQLIFTPYLTKMENEKEIQEQSLLTHDCKTGEHWDDTANKCVPNVSLPPCPEGQIRDPRTGLCVIDIA